MLDGLREYFEIILISLFLLSAVCYAIYRLTFYRTIKAELLANKEAIQSFSRKGKKNARLNIIDQNISGFFQRTVYFFADLFWVLLLVVVVRSFLYEPFVIPSSSMKPGLQIGDIVLVNKNEYGIRLPITNQKIFAGRDVARGDVVVFKYPDNEKISYIKRIVGLPGDKVFYDNRNMTINDKPITLKEIKKTVDTVTGADFTGKKINKDIDYTVFAENLLGYEHEIRYANNYPVGYPSREWIVPEDKYLVMGDNRDNSADGREFGFLDDKLMIGNATRIAFNYKCFTFDGMCDRFFKKIQ